MIPIFLQSASFTLSNQATSSLLGRSRPVRHFGKSGFHGRFSICVLGTGPCRWNEDVIAIKTHSLSSTMITIAVLGFRFCPCGSCIDAITISPTENEFGVIAVMLDFLFRADGQYSQPLNSTKNEKVRCKGFSSHCLMISEHLATFGHDIGHLLRHHR